MWVSPEVSPTGFRGPGGYFHAHEAHVMEVHFAQFGKAKPKGDKLSDLDALCHDTGTLNDRRRMAVAA